MCAATKTAGSRKGRHPKTLRCLCALGLMAKDIGIAADLAKTLGLRLNAVAGTADAWDAAQKELGASQDHTRIIEFVKANA